MSVLICVLIADLLHAAPQRYVTSEGVWEFGSPLDGVVRIQFSPHGYEREEMISDAVVLSDRPLEARWIFATDSVLALHRESIHVARRRARLNGHQEAPLPAYFYNDAYRGFRFDLTASEQVWGGGGRAIPMNRRGYRLELCNQPHYGYAEGAVNLNFSVPLFFSTAGYALFFDNVSKGYADIGYSQANILEVGFVSGPLICYLIAGPTLADMVQRYTRLTGRQDVPARWVFGAMVSRFGYQSRAQAEAVVEQMQRDSFPCDAIIFDLFWFGDSIQGTLGNLDWINPARWPEPEEMIAGFRRKGLRTILITEPFVVRTSKNFRESLPYHAVDSNRKPFLLTDFYFGHGGLLDLFRNDAQQWFWEKYQRQIEKGVSGWWGDLGEPEKHPKGLYHQLHDLGFERLFAADEVHNLYGHWWSRMLSNYYRQYYPNERLFHLNRAGFAGSQRYHVFPWTGDVHRSWSGLRAQLPLLLGLSLCGLPYIHSDAGGFALGEKDAELFTRWVQFAVFTPVLRPHGTALEDLVPQVKSIESEPIFYPEPFKSILRRYYQLRYELLPYNYTLAWQHTTSGHPLMRPMCYHTFTDTNLLVAQDQYLWGDHMLIAPVTEPGMRQRRLYLASGTWYRWKESNRLPGSQWITVPVDMHDIPIFVRAGSFICRAAPMHHTQQFRADSLLIDYYWHDSASEFILYEDDGTRPGAWDQEYRLLHFKAQPQRKRLQLSISASGTSYEGMPAQTQLTFHVYGLKRRPSTLTIGKTTIPVAPSMWNEKKRLLTFIVSFSGSPVEVLVRK